MKMRLILAVALVLAAASPADGWGQTPAARAAAPPPPAPPAGASAIFISASDLQQALERSIAGGGEPATSPITVTDQYRGSMVRRTVPNGAIAHPGNTEMHYLVEGRGAVLTGGRIVRHDGAPASIEGGESREVRAGDIIIIPAGSAHLYSRIDEPITYLEFRFLAPE